jgi:hypothetical protein
MPNAPPSAWVAILGHVVPANIFSEQFLAGIWSLEAGLDRYLRNGEPNRIVLLNATQVHAERHFCAPRITSLQQPRELLGIESSKFLPGLSWVSPSSEAPKLLAHISAYEGIAAPA